MNKYQKARQFAIKKHAGQLDDSGKDYFNAHCWQVVDILENITKNEDILCAGFLHDTLEDTETTLEELKREFGDNIANLVHEVTKEDGENGSCFPRLKSKEAILIKFADRLSNLSRMDCWNEKKQNWYLKRSRFWKIK